MNRTGCGLITITLIHLPGITGITTTSGLGMVHGTGHHGAVLTGTILGTGTTHTGGITDTIPTVPEAEAETIARPYKDPRTGIPAIRISENVLDRKVTITLVGIKAAGRRATTALPITALLLTRLSVQKATIAVLQATHLLPDSNNPVRGHPATGTEVIRLLPGNSNPVRGRRPMDSVRAMRTYGEGRPLPAGALLQARKESSTGPRKAVRLRRAAAAGATTMVRPPEVIAILPRPAAIAATGVTIIRPLRGAILLPIPAVAAVTRLRAAAVTLPRVLPGLRPPLHPEGHRPADTDGDKAWRITCIEYSGV